MADELKSSNLDLIAQLRAPCGDSVTLLTAEGNADKFDPLRLAAAREIERLRGELETERMRLAGCGVAAMADTPETAAQRLTRDSPYWSAAYGDVCRMVDRLMELRVALELACPEDPYDGGDLPCSFCGVDPGSVFHKSNCAWTRGRVALRGTVETTPNLNCPTCGVLYSGRGGQRGMPIRLSCPNGHEWNDPRGGCNS